MNRPFTVTFRRLQLRNRAAITTLFALGMIFAATPFIIDARLPEGETPRFLIYAIIFSPLGLLFAFIFLQCLGNNPVGSHVIFGTYGFLASITTVYGLNQLGGYDLSPIIDVIYRYEQHQVPVRDFISTLPVSVLALARLTASLVPSSYVGMLAIGLMFTLCVLKVADQIIRQLVQGNSVARHIILLGITVPWIATTHLWHSIIAAQIGSLAILSMARLCRCANQKSVIHLAFVAGLVTTLKPNTAIPILLATIFLMLATIRRPKVALISLSVTLCTTFFLHYFAKVSVNYSWVSLPYFLKERERYLMIFTPDSRNWWDFVSLHIVWIILPLSVLLALLPLALRRRHQIGFQTFFPCVAGITTWAIAISSNWDSHWNDFPLFSTSLGLFLATGKNLQNLHFAPKLLARGGRVALDACARGHTRSRCCPNPHGSSRTLL